MKVHILDDWFDTLRTLPCFNLLDGHDVKVWTDHEPDPAKLAARVAEAQVLVLFRERTKIGADLLDRLPNLKLVSQRSVYPHVDVDACTRNGVVLSSNMHGGTPSYAAAELTLALMLASFRQIPQQVASIRSGNWMMGVGRTLRGRTLGLYGYGRIAGAVAEYAEALGMECHRACDWIEQDRTRYWPNEWRKSEDAVVAARAAQPAWWARTAYNRGQILYRIAEMLEGRAEQFVAELQTQGLTAAAAKKEVASSIDRMIYYAGWCDKYQQIFSSVNPVASSHFNFSVLEPTGVVFVVASEVSPLLGLVSLIAPIIGVLLASILFFTSNQVIESQATTLEVLNDSNLIQISEISHFAVDITDSLLELADLLATPDPDLPTRQSRDCGAAPH